MRQTWRPDLEDISHLKHTPLHALHLSLGARMVPFAGYDMPVQYPEGVLKEHLHTRAAAGVFDVSHMGQIIVRPKSGRIEDAALALEKLVPVDILGLAEGRQRYGLFTNDEGGILDDLMITNRGDHLFLVVNAACKDADFEHLKRVSATPATSRCWMTAPWLRCRGRAQKRCFANSGRMSPPCASWMWQKPTSTT